MAAVMSSSYKLLLGLLFVASSASSLDARPSQDAARHRRRPAVVDVRRGAFDAVVSPRRRLLAAPDHRSFRGDAETTLDDKDQFPAKRRWNSSMNNSTT